MMKWKFGTESHDCSAGARQAKNQKYQKNAALAKRMAVRWKLFHLSKGTRYKHGRWSLQTEVLHFLPTFEGGK